MDREDIDGFEKIQLKTMMWRIQGEEHLRSLYWMSFFSFWVGHSFFNRCWEKVIAFAFRRSSVLITNEGRVDQSSFINLNLTKFEIDTLAFDPNRG